ncbi:Hint domain-containing protein [Sulfitobacter sp. LCG007]
MLDDTGHVFATGVLNSKTAPETGGSMPVRMPGKMTWRVPGIHGSARIETSFGQLPVQALRRNDTVLTRSGAFVAVERVERIDLDAQFLALHPVSHPVRIPAGSLGYHMPSRDLLLSAGQILQVPGLSQGASRCVAGSLAGRQGIVRQAVSDLSYYIVHCGGPATIRVEGVWLEVAASQADRG